MKNSFSKQIKIPYSKRSNKNGLDLSMKGCISRIISKNRNDSINKETIDGSCLDTQTFAFNQDSLNNSKATINKNFSLGKLDNKLIIISSLKSENRKLSKKEKKADECHEKKNSKNSNSEENPTIIQNDIWEEEAKDDDDNTNRIDFRFYPNIPEIEINKVEKYYWLATYDKLMKKSKIIKILNYYTNENENEIEEVNNNNKNNNNGCDINDVNEKEKRIKDNEYNFKEKSMIIQGYEIYFIRKYNNPFIRPKKDGKIFLKLYLLNIEQINKIFSYINRLEYKSYISSKNLELFSEKNLFKTVEKSNKTIYNYSTVFFLGSFMNIKIFLFSYLEKRKNDSLTSHFNKNDLPSSNKIAKLVKILMINFHEYSKQYFIDYLIKPIKNSFNLDNIDVDLLKQKILEINSLLISNCQKCFKRNNNSINSIIKNEIKRITTTYTISSNNCTPNEFINYSFSNYNNSTLNNARKNRSNNIYSVETDDSFLIKNKDLNQLKKDFKIRTKKSNSKFILNLKEINTNTLIKGKLNKYNSSRNCNNNHNHSILNNFKKNSKDKTLNLDMRNIDNFNKKLNYVSNSIKHISLNYPLHKNVTKNNSTNKSFCGNSNKNIENTLRKKLNSDYYNFSKIYEKSKNNIFKTSKDENKENNISFINSNYKINSALTDYNIPFNYQINKNNSNKNQEFNPFYSTNTNDINKNYIQKSKKIKIKKPIRVLSSIRKVISQKMNNISPTNSISSNNNDISNMNKSYYKYKNYLSNNELSFDSYRKYFKSNSQNKKEEYITPRKKKLFYYYH